MGVDRQEIIRRRAFEIWEDEGRPDGADQRHWLQAEDELFGDDDHETMQELLDEDDHDGEVAIGGPSISSGPPGLEPAELAGPDDEKGIFYDKGTQRQP